jgi:hypothetical protein
LSGHGAVLFVVVQPVAGTHESSVQTLPSLQTSGCPALQVPLPHTSAPSHKSLSGHGAVLFAVAQPVAGTHESSVHTLPSSQTSGCPALHVPLPHTSAPSHKSLSGHGAVLNVCWQPCTGSQESSVHGLPSSQFSGELGMHVPPPHTSAPLHTVPSAHETVFGVFAQPLTTEQVSSVHTLPSLQSSGVPG